MHIWQVLPSRPFPSYWRKMALLATLACSLSAAEPPIIAPISDQIIDQHRTLVIPITVSDPDTHPGNLQVSASSPDTDLFPPGSLIVEGASILTAPSQSSGGYIQVQPPTNGEARYFRLRKL